MPAEAVGAALGTTPEGLSAEEAARRLAAHGPNRLPEADRPGPLRRLARQFTGLLIQVLLGAAAITAMLGHWVDTAVILLVVVANAVLGFVQEGRAERALEAIRDMLVPSANVLRGGRRLAVAAEELVPGDVVLLEPGDRVPADLRLFRARALRLEEAALTGESVPAEKDAAPVEPDAPLGDRAGMAHAGTLVVAGSGAGFVVATGAATELGRVTGLLDAAREGVETPLLRQIAEFARRLTFVVLGVAALTLVFGLLVRAMPFADLFIAVVSIAVAAIPEGLPTVLTVALAIGVHRMAQRNAIIRRLPAVETLGSVGVICTDKTGTLTRNEMTVRAVALPDGMALEVGGAGYAPHGGFSRDGREVDPAAVRPLADLARAAALCNDAALREEGGAWRAEGDPMEAALLALAMKAGLDPQAEAAARPRTDAIPFDAVHRFMATLHHDHQGGAIILLKGAPERVIPMCTEAAGEAADAFAPEAWLAHAEALAASGNRVLALASRPHPAERTTIAFANVEGGLTLLGLVGLQDPPRPEAVAAVAECRAAGIRVKMITGDHAGTACAIGRQIGLANSDRAVTGAEIDRMDDATLRRVAMETDVFARTSPEHKLRLVEALRAEGAITAMTGDGVNDAPALARADVGVAMGHRGTEAAKEAAQVVLADDNFASIAAAVREGRTVRDNLRKAVVFMLPINGGESFSVLLAVLLGTTLPITPVQILWVNMVSAVALAMALAFEPGEPDAMRRPPRPAAEPLVDRFLLGRVLLVSALFLAGVFGSFQAALAAGVGVELARTVAVNTLVAMEVAYLFSVRYLRQPSFTFQGVKGTPAVLVALGLVTVLQLLFTYAPPMEALFGTRPLPPLWAGVVLAIGAALFVVLEVEKWARRRLTEGR